MTPSEIEPGTLRFVTQHLNHCANAVPLHKNVMREKLNLRKMSRFWKMLPHLEVHKYRSFAGSTSHKKVITDQKTWRDIKKTFGSTAIAL